MCEPSYPFSLRSPYSLPLVTPLVNYSDYNALRADEQDLLSLRSIVKSIKGALE
jgi:hypothetical protein